MKKLFCVIVVLLLCGISFAQASRYESVAQSTRVVNAVTVVAPLPNASILVCAFPGPCTSANKVTLYTDNTGITPADNPVSADANGNFGFWATAGNYQYVVTQKGVTFGPYKLTVAADPSNMVDKSSNQTIGGNKTFSGNTTFNGAVTAPGGINANVNGNVTGTLSGDVIGNVTGNVAGNVTGNIASSGVSTFKNANSIRYADQFANIQAAITDAGTSGSVVIPASYAGTDLFTNPNKIRIDDLRKRKVEIDVRDFGAKLDGRRITGNMTSGSAVLSSLTGMTAADIGKTVIVWGAGGGATTSLITTIASYQSATQVTLSASATSTINGGQVFYATDDTTEIQAAIDYYTSSTTAQGGYTVVIPGGALISNTLLISFKNVSLKCDGWGIPTATQNSGFIRWAGAAGIPMVKITSTYNSGVQNCNFLGNNTNKPSAAIEAYHQTGVGNTGLGRIDNVRVGTFDNPGTPDPYERMFADGVTWTGTVSNDSWTVNHLKCQNVDVCAHIQNPNASDIHFNGLFSGAQTNAFKSDGAGRWYGTNWLVTNGTGADISLGSGSRLSLHGFVGENGFQFITMTGGDTEVDVKGGSTQVMTGKFTTNFIDVFLNNASSRITLENFDFTVSPGQETAWKIRQRGSAGAGFNGLLRLVDVKGLTTNNLDIDDNGVTQVMMYEKIQQKSVSSNNWPVVARHFVGPGETPDDYRYDFLSKVNIFGGPLTVSQIATPGGAACAATGGTGTTYSYRVSYKSGAGETLAASAVTCSGGATLGGSVYNTITAWVKRGVDQFCVYGRSAGTETLIKCQKLADMGDSQITFKDDGTLTPSGALPTINTTGRVAADGGLTVGQGTAITKHLSGTATLDFAAITAPNCAADLTITVTGAAVGDTVALGAPAALAGVQYFAWVSATNTVSVRACAFTGTPDPASSTFRADVWQH